MKKCVLRMGDATMMLGPYKLSKNLGIGAFGKVKCKSFHFNYCFY